MYKKWIFFTTLLFFATISYGQSPEKGENSKSEKTTPYSEQQSNSYAPFTPDETQQVVSPAKRSKGSKNKKSSYNKFNISTEQSVGEYRERMEANAKAEEKKLREMRKPQYSDPSYFGHKRKPKIHKLKNRKFCKECGITH